MTDLEKWKAFLTEQNVGFVQQSNNGVTPVLWLSGQNVENHWAACEILFDDAGGLDHIEVAE